MKDPYALPKGWTFEVKGAGEQAGSWVHWALYRPCTNGNLILVKEERTEGWGASLEAAVGAARQWERETTPKPADPDWMVGVAREAMVEMGGEGSEERSALAALRLALERGHVVEMPRPSEDELLRASREDAAQVNDDRYPLVSPGIRGGHADDSCEVQIALRARRNMLREMGARPSNWMPPVKGGLVAGSMPREMDPDFCEVGELPSAIRSTGDVAIFYLEGNGCRVDLEAALKRAWVYGWAAARDALLELSTGTGGAETLYGQPRDGDIGLILSTLPAKE